MFSDNLSTSVQQFCSAYDLSYQEAATRCDISLRYFGSIARGQTAASISTLEKLCVGFNSTPNELLRVQPTDSLQIFRTPMPVTTIKCFTVSGKLSDFPVCPHCGSTLEREHQRFCDRCGQMLDWKEYAKATVILPGK